MIPRMKEELEVEGDVVCYYYEPNNAPKSNVVVINKYGSKGEIEN